MPEVKKDWSGFGPVEAHVVAAQQQEALLQCQAGNITPEEAIARITSVLEPKAVAEKCRNWIQ